MVTHDGGASEELRTAASTADWDKAVALLDGRWAEILSQDPGLVRDVVAALPEAIVESNPRWATARQYLDRMVGPSSVGTTRFRGSEASAAPRTVLDLLASLTAQAAGHRSSGRTAESVRAAAEAQSTLKELTPEARESLREALPELQYQWAMVYEYAGMLDEATRTYTDSHDDAVLAGNAMTVVHTAGALAWTHALSGRNIQARAWLQRLAPRTDEWWSSRSSVPAHLATTLLAYDELHLDEARAELQRVRLDLDPERWPFQKYLATLLVQDEQDALGLLSQIDASATTVPVGLMHDGVVGQLVAVTRAALLFSTGAPTTAMKTLERATTDRRTVVGQLLTCARAAAELRLGHHRAAARSVATLRHSATGTPRIQISALAITAAQQAADGERQAAEATFALALAQARRHSLYSALAVLTVADLDALVELSPEPLPDPVAARLRALLVPRTTDPYARITRREREVIAAVLTTDSLAEAAERLFVSQNTIKTQMRSIYRKLAVTSRDELERSALRYGFLPEDV